MAEAEEAGQQHEVLRQQSLRSSNLRLALRTICAAESPSRADIAAITGMTRSTVSRLVDELVAGGLVQELDPVSGLRGRPATPLVPARGTVAALGCEVGVRHLTARVIDLSGQVLAHRDVERDLAGCPAEESLDALTALALECLAEIPPEIAVAGVGLAVPGLVDAASAVVLRAPNLRWHGVKPAELWRAAGVSLAQQPLELINEADAGAITVAQSAPGRSSGRDAFLYVSGEAGVGSAAVIRGEVAAGPRGWAGELGHICIDAAGERCGCGAIGCLETFAGQPAVLDAAGAKDLDQLLARLRQNDKAAHEAVRRAGRALGLAISAALNLLDLQEIVLGGFVGALGEYLRPDIEAELQSRVMSIQFSPVTISVEDGGEWRPATGAAYRALARVSADPAVWLDASNKGGS